MEIVGYIPCPTTVLNNVSTDIKLFGHKFYVEGKGNTETMEFQCVLRCSCIVISKVPQGDENVLVYDQEYEQYTNISRGIKIIFDNNFMVTNHEAFNLINYTDGSAVEMPADCLAGTYLVNILENADEDYEAINQIKQEALAELKKITLPELDWEAMFKRQGGNYADIYLSHNFSKLTDGIITTEKYQEITGLGTTEKERQIWSGNYPIDKFAYVIQSNLDILLANQKINDATYASLYGQLFMAALQQATILEQARIQAYEQASQFQIRTIVEYYLGIITAKLNTLKSLAEYDLTLLNKAIVKMQTKLYNVQLSGFKANNINKLFQAQLDGASTAFSMGLTETPPAVYNNAELMSLYTRTGISMDVMG